METNVSNVARPKPDELEHFSQALDRIMSNAKRQSFQESADYAVRETLAWLEGVPSSTWPDREDIWRYCLEKFDAHQSLPAVTR